MFRQGESGRWQGVGVLLLMGAMGIASGFYFESVSRWRAIHVLEEQGWWVIPEMDFHTGWRDDVKQQWANWFPRVVVLMGENACGDSSENGTSERGRLSDTGRNAMDHVAGLCVLHFGEVLVEDDDVVWVERHPDLGVLGIYNSPITDRAAESIAKLKRLRVLYVDGSRMSVEGLRRLKGLTYLKKLSVKRIAADDDAVRGLLGQWPALEEVVLPSGTVVNLAGKNGT